MADFRGVATLNRVLGEGIKTSSRCRSSYIGRKINLHHEAFCTTSRSIIRLYLTFRFYLLTFRFIRNNEQI